MTAPMKKELLLSSCEEAIDLAKKLGADEAEVFASSTVERNVGIEKNDLHQSSQVSETTWGIRVVKGGAVGFCTSNQPSSLKKAVSEAVGLASIAPPDVHNGIAQPMGDIPSIVAVDEDLINYGIDELTAMAMRLLSGACRLDGRLTIDRGGVGINHQTTAVASSTGTRCSYESAAGNGFLFGMCVDGDEVGSFSYDGDTVRSAADLENALNVSFDRFVKKCAGAMGATSGESFNGPVVLPPETVSEFLMGDLIAMMGADAVRTGKSPLGEKLGEVIASTSLSIFEEGLGLKGFPICPFDREGMLRKRTPLIENGVLSNLLFNSYESRAVNGALSSNATGGASSLPSVGASAISVATGSDQYKNMVNMEQGIIVTRFSSSSNPLTGDFSGVVKGGFLVKNGERRPIEETTIAGNLYECLRSISAISDTALLMNGTVSMPAIKIDGLSVTAG